MQAEPSDFRYFKSMQTKIILAQNEDYLVQGILTFNTLKILAMTQKF